MWPAQMNVTMPSRQLHAVARGEVIERLLYEMPGTVAKTAGRRISAEEAIPFYQHQMRIVLGMNDRIDPSKIEDDIREGGYRRHRNLLKEGIAHSFGKIPGIGNAGKCRGDG